MMNYKLNYRDLLRRKPAEYLSGLSYVEKPEDSREGFTLVFTQVCGRECRVHEGEFKLYEALHRQRREAAPGTVAVYSEEPELLEAEGRVCFIARTQLETARECDPYVGLSDPTAIAQQLFGRIRRAALAPARSLHGPEQP